MPVKPTPRLLATAVANALTISLTGSLMAALPTAASAASDAPTEAQMQAMEARLKAMEAKMDAMQKLLDAKAAGAPPAPPSPAAASGWGQPVADNKDAPAQLTQGELDTLKQKVARQELKVGALFEDARTGPMAGLSITGYVDPSYVVNRRQRTASFYFLDGQDPYTYYNSSIGDVFLDIKKTFGDGTYAPSIDLQLMPYRGYGAFTTNGSGSTFGNIFTTALVTIPLTDLTSVAAGYTPSFAGYEYQASTQMLTMSHGLLYDWSEPGTYMGVGLNHYKGNWSFKSFIGNEEYRSAGAVVPHCVDGTGATVGCGDPNVTVAAVSDVATNRTPSVTGRFDYTWSTALDIGGSVSLGRNTLLDYGNGFYGYQGTGTHAFGNKAYAELDMTYATPDQQLNAQLDYGQLQNGAWNGERAVWWGFSALAHQKWSTASLGRIGATARLDYLNNQRNGGGGGGLYLGSGLVYGTDTVNGFGIRQKCYAQSSLGGLDCKGANRVALTTAFMAYPTDQITLKAEYRRDWANFAVFGLTDGRLVRSNDIFGLQLVYAF
jgi:hypothetical protein